MSTHNICFHGEIRKIAAFFGWKKHPICCYEPLWVILCRFPEKGRKEIVEEMKERDREERDQEWK